MTPAWRMRACNRLARIASAVERAAEEVARQASRAVYALAYCEMCGEKRYTGRTCRDVLGYTPDAARTMAQP